MRSGDERPRGSAPPHFAPDRWRAGFDERSGQGAWPAARRLRLWLPVIVSFVVQVPFAVVRVTRPGAFDSDGPTAAAGLVLALIGPVVLIAARAFPGPVVALTAAAASADLLLPGGAIGPPYVALAFAIVSAVVRGARGWAWVSVAAGWVVTLVGGSLLGTQFRPFPVVGITLGILVVLGIAEGVRSRRERFAHYASSAAARRQTAAQAERVRIARELHDVLAHSLSQINVQAGVGLHLMPTHPEKAAEALANIKESSKIALDEVRGVLGILRGEAGESPDGSVDVSLTPEPGLTTLPALVASVRSGRLAIELSVDTGADPSAAIQLAVYRIVQESLTNVVRHSSASMVHVSVIAADHSLRVIVADDGGGGRSTETDGRGLIGMRERAELLGGSLAVSNTPRGFTVTALLPLDRDSSA